ncbi:hypothetical protein [Hyalangium rubrum]|uniref:Vitamin K epoxide reductase domain-containing protein n=1 Tax=Hyalangium rubrum TaxID=3103134 RepID=A0ABU5HE42_9BACT|nr:hypothetical protein [Hyalangium sp. s54d21]MDY7231739.1 hypothetical protein [Hyalangium sp. s54d21]
MTSVPPRTGSSTPASLGRAALVGLCGGLLSGGVMLVVLGLRGLFSPPSCEGLGKMECDMVQEAAIHVGRVQTICGGALFALAIAIFVMARPYLSPRPPAPTSPSQP